MHRSEGTVDVTFETSREHLFVEYMFDILKQIPAGFPGNFSIKTAAAQACAKTAASQFIFAHTGITLGAVRLLARFWPDGVVGV